MIAISCACTHTNAHLECDTACTIIDQCIIILLYVGWSDMLYIHWLFHTSCSDSYC